MDVGRGSGASGRSLCSHVLTGSLEEVAGYVVVDLPHITLHERGRGGRENTQGLSSTALCSILRPPTFYII